MISSTILFITLLTPAGVPVDVLPLRFDTRAECLTEKARVHAATRADVTGWRLLRADCVPVRGAK